MTLNAPATLTAPAKDRVIKQLRELEPELRREYGVRAAYLFGSVARGDDHDGSDVDVAVDMPYRGRWQDRFRVQNLIGDKLGRNVDVVRLPFAGRLREFAEPDLVRAF